MHAMSLLPFIGGSVSLFSSIWLFMTKRSGDPAKLLFFISLLSLGLFGFFETLGYLSRSERTAVLLLKTAWSAALLTPYLVMSFATLLRGETKWHKTMAAPMAITLCIALLFIVQDARPEPWGWYVTYNLPVALLAFGLVIVFMTIGMHELRCLATEIRENNRMLSKSINIMIHGFIIWLVLALVTNGSTFLLDTGMMPLFSFVQLFPSIIVLYGYHTGTRTVLRNNGKRA